MKLIFNIGLTLFFLGITSCNSEPVVSEILVEEKGELYINEYGEIRLIELNDTLMQTVFKNNDGDVFDTTMVIIPFSKLNENHLMDNPDSMSFLRFHCGGLQLYENRIELFDFCSIANYLGVYHIQIAHAYERPFFKSNVEISLTDQIIGGKGLYQMNGIYLDDKIVRNARYGTITGKIVKEEFPSELYSSTDESPQGFSLSNEDETSYWLKMEDFQFTPIERWQYTGSAINIDGEAAFISDIARSEAYYIENHSPWTPEELNTRFVIDAVLVQDSEGRSTLTHWTITKE